MNKTGIRAFKVKFRDGEWSGRYMGMFPYQAANKALSEIIRKNNIKCDQKINFDLYECTKNSKNKIYKYIGFREKTIITYKINDNKMITKNFKNNLKKIKKMKKNII
tara:strand:+ start:19 stop:339 length:321 start_codon:yes stop_codon:yes gene_type:complete